MHSHSLTQWIWKISMDWNLMWMCCVCTIGIHLRCRKMSSIKVLIMDLKCDFSAGNDNADDGEKSWHWKCGQIDRVNFKRVKLPLWLFLYLFLYLTISRSHCIYAPPLSRINRKRIYFVFKSVKFAALWTRSNRCVAYVAHSAYTTSIYWHLKTAKLRQKLVFRYLHTYAHFEYTWRHYEKFNFYHLTTLKLISPLWNLYNTQRLLPPTYAASIRRRVNFRIHTERKHNIYPIVLHILYKCESILLRIRVHTYTKWILTRCETFSGQRKWIVWMKMARAMCDSNCHSMYTLNVYVCKPI